MYTKTTFSLFLCISIVAYVAGQSLNPFAGADMLTQGNQAQNSKQQGSAQEAGNSGERQGSGTQQEGNSQSRDHNFADQVLFNIHQCIKHEIEDARAQNQMNSGEKVKVRFGDPAYG